MSATHYALRSFFRELRSGEVMVLLAAVSLAVAALTAVGFLTDRVSRAVERQANEVLAADLRLRSPDPIPTEWHELAREYELRSAETATFPTVVFSGDLSSLATVMAVSTNYPLRGQVRISEQLFTDQRIAEGIPAENTVWADAALLARLGVDIGDTISVGELKAKVGSVLIYRPDQSIGFASLAPTLILNSANLNDTGLVKTGSRVRYAFLVAGIGENVEAFYQAFEQLQPASVRARSREEGSDRAITTAERAQRFLSLTAVISLLLSAVAIAMSARRFAQRRLDTVALMKSLGASQNLVISSASGQLFLLGILGVVTGSFAGFLVEKLVVGFLGEFVQTDLPPIGWGPVFLAAGSALILLFGFAMPALMQLKNTPPLRVLRHDAMPPPVSRLFIGGCSLIAVTVMLYISIGDSLMLLLVLGGVLAVAALLYGAGRILVSLLGRARAGVGVAWRYGLSNVSRRGRDSAIQVVAFGLGLTVLLLLTFVRVDLLESWQQTLAENAPDHFMINVQPDERASIADIFRTNNRAIPEFAPMVRARMQTINGEDVRERRYPVEDGQWMANREQNLSWAKYISSTNKVVEGRWWAADYTGEPLVSIEREAALELGLSIGDKLTYIIAGQQLEASVFNVREVNWDSFQPNFFMVLSPGSLDAYPSTFISGIRLTDNKEQVLTELIRTHPTVSVIDIGSILIQVKGIIDKASLAVQVVFLFTLVAGLLVLFASVHATIDQRRFESAILCTLGARRSTVLAGVLAEFAVIGMVAGVLASLGASLLAAAITVNLFDLEYTPNMLLWAAGLIGGVALVCASGYLALRRAISVPPVAVLRA